MRQLGQMKQAVWVHGGVTTRRWPGEKLIMTNIPQVKKNSTHQHFSLVMDKVISQIPHSYNVCTIHRVAFIAGEVCVGILGSPICNPPESIYCCANQPVLLCTRR